MIKLMEVGNEESMYQGIDKMWIALEEKQADEQPKMKKMQAPADWEAIAQEYAPIHPGPLQPFITTTE
jgi:hypothetical protein